MFTTVEIVGQAEWIIDDTCLVLTVFQVVVLFFSNSYKSLLSLFEETTLRR